MTESEILLTGRLLEEKAKRITELEAQVLEANARAAVVVNVLKGLQMAAEGKITEKDFESILKRSESDLAKSAEWLADYTEASVSQLADAEVKNARLKMMLDNEVELRRGWEKTCSDLETRLAAARKEIDSQITFLEFAYEFRTTTAEVRDRLEDARKARTNLQGTC